MRQVTGPEQTRPLTVYLRLLRYVKPYRGAFALGMSGGLAYAIAMVAFAPYAKHFTDGTLTHSDPRTIIWLPVALVALLFLRSMGDFTQTYFTGYVSRRVVTNIRQEVFDAIQRLPIAYFDRNSSGNLLSRLTYNVELVGTSTSDSVVMMVRSALQICAALGYAMYLNYKLTIMALVMAPVMAWLVSRINHYFRRYARRIQDSMGDVTRVAKESLEAPRLIKIYNAEAHLGRQFGTVNERNRHSYMRLILTKGLSNPIIQTINSIGMAFVLAFAISAVVHGRMTMGELFGFIVALAQISQPVQQFIGVIGQLQQGIAAAQNLFELLDEPAEPQTGGIVVGRVRGDVHFDNVVFSYERGKGRALDGLSLEVPAGQQVAIVGRSGSGKSTLVSLLPRFHDVLEGAVRIDGRDVREYTLHSLREQIAAVSQEIVLFDDTIRNNIAFGRAADAAAIERAAEAAHVLEFARALPLGLDTMVGDRGVLLSGGQRQRIAIARALLKDAPILILDEATSALDTEAERHIQAALAQLVRNRTTFVIAHRLSTVEQADRIIVLDAGRIVESGAHAELLALGGVYAQLHALQFKS
ncbi:MAG TPA: lipid A export permease/ATP-binding protein MsbA [Steroidobacteraceae bacterium]|jgi:subfamily B ATP-binding cassette protein MsbA|nr:lipid A export permease/ATP-binding protein MsbA [Steroidobacteraceae bacterium]